MKLNKFAVPYAEDKRMIYACEYLQNKNFTYTNSIEDADFVLLPVPSKKYMFENLNGKPAFCAMYEYENGYDYMKNESYVFKNALLTSEGAVSFIEENAPYSLYRRKILIIGYGRIGKTLHKILNGYGSFITVCSRSASTEAQAVLNGANHIYFDKLNDISDEDIIINTVPHIALTASELKSVKKDALILDLASFPGGVDTLVAKSLGLNLLSGKAMPCKFTEKTAGYIIGEAVTEIIKEELT
ncbi:MAG: hypothetical protein LUG21_05540 [Clostridiales bacterium]|nr:hypothetical protein [Clostridiales bacterium]